jgi:hypothetical protein
MYYIIYKMNNIFLILLVLILIMYYLNKKNNDNFHEDIRAKQKSKRNIDYLDDLLKFADNSSHSSSNGKFNLDFVEAQFHNDYRDTITGFNNIAPSQKQVFNMANVPVNFSNPNPLEVKKLISDFIKELNNNIMNEVPDYRTANSGWDELLQDKKCESGWEKSMKSLGLPKSIYPDPAKKSKVKIIKLDHVEKYETEDEIKYACFLFLKKSNVEDILVIKVSFVLDKRIINEERMFFEERNTETRVILEEIYILGYMTEKGVGRSNHPRDKFYNFYDLEKDGILDDKEILRQLNKKLAERHRETQRFDNNLDDQFRELKTQTPHLSNFNSYQTTQTIYDDLLKPRNYS